MSFSADQKREKQKLVYRIFNRGLSLGVIERPASCSRCGKSEQIVVGHHWDYDKPLEVEWVCTRCHLVDIHEVENTNITWGTLDCEQLLGVYGHLFSGKDASPDDSPEPSPEDLYKLRKVGPRDKCDYIRVIWTEDKSDIIGLERLKIVGYRR